MPLPNLLVGTQQEEEGPLAQVGYEQAKRELPYVLLYFVFYLASLFLTRESEWAHRLSLVAVPLIGFWWLRRRQGVGLDLSSLGLRKG